MGNNGIRVEDLLNMEKMETSKLIAGFKGIGNTITTINIVADPDIMEWTHPGEFLFTTAYYFTESNIQNFKDLLIKCSNNKLAGMGVKLRPYMDELPADVINLADQLNFPLVDVDGEMALSDIIMPAYREIFKKQASLLDRIESVQGLFTSAMLDGKGIPEIVSIVEDNIKNPTVLSLSYMDTMELEFGNISEASKEVFLEDVKKFDRLAKGKNLNKKIQEDKILHNGKFIKRIIVPIILKDRVYGHFFAWSTSSPLGGFDISILESAATITALSVLQDLSIKEVEIRYRSEFFEDLISPDIKRRGKALERAHFLNLSLDKYYVVEVMSFKFPDEDRGKDEDGELIFEYLKEYANIIVMAVEDVMDYYDLDGIVSTKLSGIQILLSFDELDSIDEKLDRFNDRVLDALIQRYPTMDIKVGVGRVYKGLDEINKSFSDAVKAIRTGKIVSDDDVIAYNELGIFKILSQDFLTEELEDFYELTLEPLVKYDNERSTELVKTLSAYFEHNGNLTRMSENLFTHYNTILYRINRINEITEMDLDDPNDRLNLEIALKIKELL